MRLLGHDAPLPIRQSRDGLDVERPEGASGDHACCSRSRARPDTGKARRRGLRHRWSGAVGPAGHRRRTGGVGHARRWLGNGSDKCRDRARSATRRSPRAGLPASLIATLDPARPRSSQVYTLMRRAIIEMMLPPGSMINERQICEELAVSRTPLREALLKLQDRVARHHHP